MNIVVFGLGAIGIVYAVSLKNSGHKVFGITKGKYLDKLSNPFFKIKGIFGEKEAVLDGVFKDCDLLINENIDLVILSVKAFDTEVAIREIKKIIKDNTLVILAQNGYGNYELACKELGANHVILGRVIFGSKLLSINVAEVTVIADDVVIGQPENKINKEILLNIAKILDNSGIPTRYSEDVYAILWDKIIYNCALNPLGAILECNYGSLASNPYT
ncbi:MAG: 2-dehydropantoate 2-reductase, partial [Proteobacteria bacterium]|nr:2-dehydropantoate 2-reductase [Pseudomonadota bacterium]